MSNNWFIKLTLLIYLISLFLISELLAQDRQEKYFVSYDYPEFILNGKWAGNIEGAVKEGNVWYPFTVELVGGPGSEKAFMRLKATYPSTFVFDSKIGILFYRFREQYKFVIYAYVGDPVFKDAIAYAAAFMNVRI